jgi:hypothetical protein
MVNEEQVSVPGLVPVWYMGTSEPLDTKVSLQLLVLFTSLSSSMLDGAVWDRDRSVLGEG